VEFEVREEGNICLIKLKGRLVSGEPVKQFQAAYQPSLANGHPFLVLDLEQAPYIDSSGIGAIVNALNESRKLGGSTKLLKPAPFVENMLKLTNLLTLFGVFGTEAEAIAACGR
jgi:anti-anti-sigma factor